MSISFICGTCGKAYPVSTLEYKCSCGGAFTLDFEPPPFDLSLVDKDEWSMFRYRHFLPLDGDAYKAVSLGEGMSPTLELERDLWVKMDYMMPTLSFKDRGAVMVMALCRQLGIKKVVQDSSGNAGNSIAAYAARCGIECEIYVPKDTSSGKISMIKAHGASVNAQFETRDAVAQACRREADKKQAYYASHVFNPFFYQGTKTYIYEVFEQLKKLPDNIFIPLGNGTLFLGAMMGLYELLFSGLITKLPNIYAVQSEMCDPIHKAFLSGEKSPSAVEAAPTLAEGISIARPVRGREILDYIYKSGAEVIISPEDEIISAHEALAQKGAFVEHTTAATYAAYLKHRREKGLTGSSLLPLCGAGLKSHKG